MLSNSELWQIINKHNNHTYLQWEIITWKTYDSLTNFYFISFFSHNTRTTQWDDPRIAAAQALFEQQNSVETLFNPGSQTLNTSTLGPPTTPNGKFMLSFFNIFI
jgi:hypothetical protein